MKSFQFFLINALTVIIALGLISGAFVSKREAATTAPFESLPKIQIQKLGKYRGQYLTVFYGKETRTLYISGDYVSLPELTLEKQINSSAKNRVVFAISPSPGYTMPPSDNNKALLISSFSKDEIESLSIGQGLDQGLVLTLE